MSTARRRVMRLLAAGACAAALPVRPAVAVAQHGRIEPPQPVPSIDLVRHDGGRTTLAQLAQGRTTALHFMFTGCRAACPIQGAVFARIQQQLPAQVRPRIQLLSLSVDALGDDPAALTGWLGRLDAGPAWRAAVPSPAHAERLRQWAGNGQPFAYDRHATQVLLLDARGRLVWRTLDLPDPAEVVQLLVAIDGAVRG